MKHNSHNKDPLFFCDSVTSVRYGNDGSSVRIEFIYKFDYVHNRPMKRVLSVDRVVGVGGQCDENYSLTSMSERYIPIHFIINDTHNQTSVLTHVDNYDETYKILSSLVKV